MTTPGPEATGGAPSIVGETVDAARVPDPAVEALEIYATTLRTQAEQRAPGTASAAWENWPENVEPSSSIVPSMVRAGSIMRNGEQIPIIVPGAGEAHILLGDSRLLQPTPQQPVPKDAGQFELEGIKKRLASDHRAAEQERFAAIAAERPAAVAAMRAIMLRTVSSMRPGSVRFELYDQQMGADFRDFSALGNTGPGRSIYAVGGNMGSHLLRLINHIGYMNTEGLRGAPSLRELARSGELPQPFVLSVLLGNGRPLNPEARKMLDTVLTQGPACGVTLLAHGFDIPTNRMGNAHRIHRASLNPRDTRVSTRAAANIRFQPDPSPPPSIVMSTARTIAIADQQRRAVNAKAAGTDPRRKHLSIAPTPPLLVPFEKRTPGVAYNTAITDASNRASQMQRLVSEFRANYPFIEPGAVAAFTATEGQYLQYADRVAADHGQLRHDIGELAHYKGTVLERLQAWAAFELVLNTPGQRRNHIVHARHAKAGHNLVHTNLPALIQTVAITAQHGHEFLPEAVRGWVVQDLHEDPPAYAFQLVADHATHSTLVPGSETGHENAALYATVTHLEDTYGVRLRAENGEVANQHLLEALIECEVIRLYAASNPAVPEPTLDAVVRRSHRRLERVPRGDLPEGAQRFYDACMDRLKIIGRIDNWRETATVAAATALQATVRGLSAGGAAMMGLPLEEELREGGVGRHSTPRHPQP